MANKRQRSRFLSPRQRQFEVLEKRDLLAINLVADVNQLASRSSNPRELVNVGPLTFFVADSEVGTELWKTDGTAGGTMLVKDIVEGPGSSFPTDLIEANGLLFFETHAVDDVPQLWRSDGTESGTFSLEGGEIVAATSSRVLYGSVQFGGLAQTDGTLAGSNAAGAAFVVGAAEDYYVLVARAGQVLQYQLVRDSGDVVVLRDRSAESDAEDVFRDGVLATFLVNSEESETLTTYETQLTFNDVAVPDAVHEFSVPGRLTKFHDEIARSGEQFFFVTEQPREVVEDVPRLSDYTMWSVKVDGSAPPIAIDQFVDNPLQPVVSELTTGDNGDLWFVAEDDLVGNELRKSDGTVEGTAVFADVLVGEAGSNPHSLRFIPATENSVSVLWFIADDGESGDQVFQVLGTDELDVIRTSSFSDASPFLLGARGIANAFFSADDGEGVELWAANVIDGVSIDVFAGPNGSFPTSLVANSNDDILFAATTEVGRELWKYRRGGQPTLVKDIYASSETRGSNPHNLVPQGDRLFFAANDGLSGVELWSVDGTGAKQVKDIAAGPAGSHPTDLVDAGEWLYFVADDGVHGRELWMSDGTDAGTRLAVDAFEGPFGSSPEQLVAFNGAVYFTATDRLNVFPLNRPTGSTRALWKFDGQSATRLRTLPLDGRVPPEFRSLTAAADGVYFYELATFDGVTKAVLQRVNAGGEVETIQDNLEYRQQVYEIKTAGDRVVYGANPMGGRTEVWTIGDDGAPRSLSPGIRIEGSLLTTPSNVFFTDRRGDVFVSDLSTDGDAQVSEELAGLKEVLQTDLGYFFAAASNDAGSRLQFSASLADGVETLATFGDGQLFPASLPRELTEYNGEVYFIADLSGDEFGTEVWKTDGTAEGTRMVTSLDSDLLRSRTSSLTVVQDRLYFVANDGETGHEIWSIDEIPNPGDLDDSGQITATDIDSLFASIGQAPGPAGADVTGDGVVERDDVDAVVRTILQTEFGDANLDQRVNFSDFLVLSQSFGRTDASWSQGDFDGDGVVSFADFLVLSSNFGFRL